MQVAIYARGDSGDAETTTYQIEQCRQLCEQKGYVVADVFVDEPRSGIQLAHRPAFTLMSWQAMELRFEKIVAWDLYRLSPDQTDAAHFFKKMEYLDIDLETVKGGKVSAEDVGISQLAEQLYFKDLGSRAHQAVIASVLRGSVPGGHIYGYEPINAADKAGARRVVPEQADVVRRIFKSFNEGTPIASICRQLNEDDIAAPKGGEWVSTTLLGSRARESGLLRQTLYKGVITFNKMGYTADPKTGKRRSFVKPHKEWIRVPLPELAIIDAETFEAAQARITAPRPQKDVSHSKTRTNPAGAPTRGRKHAVYGGRLFCAEHGSQIKARYADKYGCDHAECQNRTLDQGMINARVTNGIIAIDGDALFVEVRKWKIDHELDGLMAELARLRSSLQRKQAQKDTVLMAAKGAVGKGVNLYLASQTDERQRISREISQIEAESRPVTRKQARNGVALLKKMARRLKADPREQEATTVLRNLIKSFELPTESKTAPAQVTWDLPALSEWLSQIDA